MKRPFRELKRRFCGRVYFDTGRSPDQSILLAGTSRSGTTWVGDLINANNTFRVMFEPFHRRSLHLMGARAFFDEYLPEDENNPELLRLAEFILSGRAKNAYIDAHNRRFLCSRRLLKAVCANVSLKWIRRRFPQVPIVFLIRHPSAVAESKIALGWPDHVDFYFEQPKLYADFLGRLEYVRRPDLTPFQRHVLHWCIENVVPLSVFEPGEMYPLLYEHVRDEPGPMMRQLYEHLRLPSSRAASRVAERPSLTARPGQLARGPSWARSRSDAEVEGAQDIVTAFGLDYLYDVQGCPRVAAQGDLLLGRTPEETS